MRAFTAQALACLLVLLPLGASAGDDSSPEPGLGRAVPSDALLYFRYRLEPGSVLARGAESIGEFLAREEFAGRLFSLLFEQTVGAGGVGVDEEGRRRFEKLRDRWLDLLRGVDWSTLFASEVVLAARVEKSLPEQEEAPGGADASESAPDEKAPGDASSVQARIGPRELILLFHVPPDRREEVLEGLQRVLYALCAVTPLFEITESWTRDEQIVVLHDVTQDEGICLAGRGDAVFLATSTRLLRRSLQLHADKGSDLGFEYTSRRIEGLAGVAVSPAKLSESGAELHVSISELLPDIGVLGGLESLVVALEPSGEELRYGYQLRFSGGASLARDTFLDRRGVEDWRKTVPPGADCFQVSSGSDPLGLLQFTVAVLRPFQIPGPDDENVAPDPRGWRPPAPLDGLVSLLTGRRTVLADKGELAILFELRDPGKALDVFEDTLPALEELLRARGVPSRSEDAGDASGRLQSVEPASGGRRFIFGVVGRHLALGTSADLVRRATKKQSTSPGDEGLPRLEGLAVPTGDLQSITFSDPPLFVLLPRVGLDVLTTLSRNTPDPSEKLKGTELSGLLLEFASLLDVLKALGRDSSYTVREGDSLRGAGNLHLQTRRKSFRERRL